MSNKTPVLIAGLETQEASAADSVADLSEIYENMKRRKTLEGVMNPEKAPVGLLDAGMAAYLKQLRENPRTIFRGTETKKELESLFSTVCLSVAQRVARSMEWGAHALLHQTLHPSDSKESAAVNLKCVSKSDSVLQYGRTPLDFDCCGEKPLDFKSTIKESRRWFQRGRAKLQHKT